jgi:hypothetical protein
MLKFNLMLSKFEQVLLILIGWERHRKRFTHLFGHPLSTQVSELPEYEFPNLT